MDESRMDQELGVLSSHRIVRASHPFLSSPTTDGPSACTAHARSKDTGPVTCRTGEEEKMQAKRVPSTVHADYQ